MPGGDFPRQLTGDRQPPPLVCALCTGQREIAVPLLAFATLTASVTIAMLVVGAHCHQQSSKRLVQTRQQLGDGAVSGVL